jgi:hypothetical protein
MALPTLTPQQRRPPSGTHLLTVPVGDVAVRIWALTFVVS